MKLLFTLLAFCFSLTAQSGPIIVGGAGEGEYSVTFVHKNINLILNDCLDFSCTLSSSQRALLVQISSSHILSFAPVFKSSREMTTLFLVRPLQNEVYINQDKLWTDSDRTLAFDVGDALTLWIQIVGHELGIDDQKVKNVAQIAAESLKNQVQRGGVSLEDRQTFEFLLWQRGSETRFLARDPAMQSVGLTELINGRSLNCSARVSNTRIYSPTWGTLSEGTNQNTLNATLHFGISWTCADKHFNTNALIYAKVVRENSSARWMFDKNSVGIFVNFNFVDVQFEISEVVHEMPIRSRSFNSVDEFRQR